MRDTSVPAGARHRAGAARRTLSAGLETQAPVFLRLKHLCSVDTSVPETLIPEWPATEDVYETGTVANM